VLPQCHIATWLEPYQCHCRIHTVLGMHDNPTTYQGSPRQQCLNLHSHRLNIVHPD
jgi:hypothetical protein